MKPHELSAVIESETSLRVLRGYLRHTDPAVRGVAIEKLMDFPRKTAIDALVVHLKTETVESIRTAIYDYLRSTLEGRLPSALIEKMSDKTLEKVCQERSFLFTEKTIQAISEEAASQL